MNNNKILKIKKNNSQDPLQGLWDIQDGLRSHLKDLVKGNLLPFTRSELFYFLKTQFQKNILAKWQVKNIEIEVDHDKWSMHFETPLSVHGRVCIGGWLPAPTSDSGYVWGPEQAGLRFPTEAYLLASEGGADRYASCDYRVICKGHRFSLRNFPETAILVQARIDAEPKFASWFFNHAIASRRPNGHGWLAIEDFNDTNCTIEVWVNEDGGTSQKTFHFHG